MHSYKLFKYAINYYSILSGFLSVNMSVLKL